MNFAVIVDAVGGVKSYQVKDNRGYDFDGVPYGFNVSIGNEFYHSMWSYPSLYDGYFINWKYCEDGLPDLDLDFSSVLPWLEFLVLPIAESGLAKRFFLFFG